MTLFHIVMFNHDISLNVYGLVYEVSLPVTADIRRVMFCLTNIWSGIHIQMLKFKTGTVDKNLSSTIGRTFTYGQRLF